MGCQARLTSWSRSLWVRKITSALSWASAAGRDGVGDLVEQGGVVVEPALVVDDRAEVEVDLVAGLEEVVDRRDPLGDRRGPDVDQLGDPARASG